MAVKRKLSKQKGIELCANLLFSGNNRKQILQELAKVGNISSSTVDKWLKEARVIAEARQAEAEETRIRETDALTVEALKSGLKSDLELEVFLCQLVMGDVFIEDIIKGTTVLRGVSPLERIKATELIYKKRGSCAPAKVAQTDKDGNDVPPVPQLVINQIGATAEIAEKEDE